MIIKEHHLRENKNFNISEYNFSEFNNRNKNVGDSGDESGIHAATNKVKGFLFDDLVTPQKWEDKKAEIQTERDQAQQNDFVFSPIVEKFRGLKRLEIEEKNTKIEIEVNRRISKISEEAQESGFGQGKKEAMKSVYESNEILIQKEIAEFRNLVQEISEQQKQVLEGATKKIFLLLKSLSKWVILRELKDDGEYIQRLFEKIALELGSKKNLLVKVNEENAKKMPEIFSRLIPTLGELKNVRIEIDNSLGLRGAVVESEFTIIDGAFETQMEKLDALFEKIN
jgi:flagellar assembly protein FliH